MSKMYVYINIINSKLIENTNISVKKMKISFYQERILLRFSMCARVGEFSVFNLGF